MTNDNILDRIDAVLGHEDTVIDDDWTVSPDAMRSRPPAEHDTPYDPDVPRSLGLAPGRVTFVPSVGDPRSVTTAELAAGIDLTQHFNCRSVVAPIGLPAPRPNLRLRVITALGLMPILTKLTRATAQLVDRARQLLERIDPRRAARDRRAGRTITINLRADTTEFERGVSRAMVRIGALGGTTISRATLGIQLMGSAMQAAVDYERVARQVAAYNRVIARSEIRMIADVHRLEARLWLDRHVDTIYADLGLTRPQED